MSHFSYFKIVFEYFRSIKIDLWPWQADRFPTDFAEEEENPSE